MRTWTNRLPIRRVAAFDSKVAFLIPDTEERRRFAELFRTCMEAQGFSFQQFFAEEAAMAWLSPIV